MTNEQGHFLDNVQKNIKADIMQRLMDVYFDSIVGHLDKFSESPQALSDLCTSIMVMFLRDILVHYIHSFNLESQRKEVMKSLFDTIKTQVNERIKGQMQ